MKIFFAALVLAVIALGCLCHTALVQLETYSLVTHAAESSRTTPARARQPYRLSVYLSAPTAFVSEPQAVRTWPIRNPPALDEFGLPVPAHAIPITLDQLKHCDVVIVAGKSSETWLYDLRHEKDGEHGTAPDPKGERPWGCLAATD